MDEDSQVSGGVKGLLSGLLLWALAGCGIIGPPIPPEDVGLTPVIERQKKQQAQQTGAKPPAVEPAKEPEPPLNEPRGQDEDLPPLRPVGTR